MKPYSEEVACNMSLEKYALKRFIEIIPVFLIVLSIVFLMLHLIPGDPAKNILGIMATPESLEQLRETLGLNEPIYKQFYRFMRRLVVGDFGHSIRYKAPVTMLIFARLKVTLALVCMAGILSVIFSLPISLYAAKKHRKFTDYSIGVSSLFVFSMPEFWTGLLFLNIFGLKLGWFPTGGWGTGVLNNLYHLIMPSVILGLFLTALVTRTLRSDMLEVLQKEYIRLARTYGFSDIKIYTKYALKNALLPTITVIGLNLGWLLGSSVVIETVFSLPGIGAMLLDAVIVRDYPLIQGISLIFALAIMLNNYVVDIIYGLIDPRIYRT